jgi:hypothetical protein
MVEDIGVDTKTRINERLDHGGTPAGTPEAGLARPFLKQGGEGGFLRWGQFRRAARGLCPWRALAAIAAKPVDPGCNSLLVHTQDQSDLRTALAIHDREDGEEIFDLA